MSKKLFAIALVLGTFRSFAAFAGSLVVDESDLDFGEKFQFTEFDHDIKVWNNSDQPVQFMDRKDSPNAGKLTIDKKLIGPHDSATAKVHIPLGRFAGRFAKSLDIDTEEAGQRQTYRISVRGFVESVFDDIDPGVNFGVIDIAAPDVEKSLRLMSTEFPSLRLTKVFESPGFVDVRIDGANQLNFTARPGRDILGIRKGVAKIAVDSPQKEVWVNVLMDVHGDVVPDQNPLSFGLQRRSSAHEVRLELNSRSGTAFDIGRVNIDSANIDFKHVDCLPKKTISCEALLLKIQKDHPQGQIAGTLSIELPNLHQRINVLLAGLFLDDATAIHSLNDPNEVIPGRDKSATTSRLDLQSAIDKATHAEVNSTPPGIGPVLKWDVANEFGIYGYAIYRSDSVSGVFTRMNEKIVAAENKGDNTDSNYQYRDNTAVSGKEYWYYISIFYDNGKRVQLTGPQKVVAK